jgi:hypothetical protein
MKTTKASFAPDADEPKFEFEPVDAALIQAAAEEVLRRRHWEQQVPPLGLMTLLRRDDT